MRRPGFGSAVVRVAASAWSLLWLASIPEFLEVWGEPSGYTIPSQMPLPRATIWVVSALMVATAVFLNVGWWRRRRGTRSPAIRFADWVLAIVQATWAVLLMWSAIIDIEERRMSGGYYAAGFEAYFEFILAAISLVIAVILARDAIALSRDTPSRPEATVQVEGRTESVVRWLLVVACGAVLLATALQLVRWGGDNDTFGWDLVTLPWGPVLTASTAGLSIALLLGASRWRRDGRAPGRAATWLWVAAALQAFWAVLLCAALLFDPHALRWQVAFGVGGTVPMVCLIATAIGVAVLHDRDARRLEKSDRPTEFSAALEPGAGVVTAE
jgi:hypothetical protein